MHVAENTDGQKDYMLQSVTHREGFKLLTWTEIRGAYVEVADRLLFACALTRPRAQLGHPC